MNRFEAQTPFRYQLRLAKMGDISSKGKGKASNGHFM